MQQYRKQSIELSDLGPLQARVISYICILSILQGLFSTVELSNTSSKPSSSYNLILKDLVTGDHSIWHQRRNTFKQSSILQNKVRHEIWQYFDISAWLYGDYKLLRLGLIL